MLGELLLMCAAAVGGHPPGCSNMPIRNSFLIPGIYQPRPNPNIKFVYIDDVKQQCEALLAAHGEIIKEGTITYGCSVVPRDEQLTEQPYCIIYLPKNPNLELIEHERRHCEGWAHPSN